MYALPSREFSPASGIYIVCTYFCRVHSTRFSPPDSRRDMALLPTSQSHSCCPLSCSFSSLVCRFPGSLAARLADALLFPAVHTYTPGNRTRGRSPFQAVWRNLSTRMATARSALADGVVGLAPAVIPYLVWDALPRRPWQGGGADIALPGIALFLILFHLFFPL